MPYALVPATGVKCHVTGTIVTAGAMVRWG
jgi:hypothetical protein